MGFKIIVADDHALTLEGVVSRLEVDQDMQVVGTANRGSDVMSLVKERRPDVALLDIHMPGMDGMACLALIKSNFPDVKVLMLSAFTDEGHIASALEAGASAYIVKSVDPVDLPAAVRLICNGTVFQAFGGIGSPGEAPAPANDRGLTDRERTMLGALARGLSNKAISREFWVTEQTVKFHLNNVYRKLGVDNRAAAVRFAFEHGLVQIEHDGKEALGVD